MRAVLALMVGLVMASGAWAQERTMMTAEGSFSVAMTPVAPDEGAEPDLPGRMTLIKAFQGGLEGTARGEMLGLHDGRVGAYVAMERVTGSLNGRVGSFALVHRGVMNAQGQDLTITVVPGSGTGQLAGLEGEFHLTIEEGRHRYRLDYSLPDD